MESTAQVQKRSKPVKVTHSKPLGESPFTRLYDSLMKDYLPEVEKTEDEQKVVISMDVSKETSRSSVCNFETSIEKTEDEQKVVISMDVSKLQTDDLEVSFEDKKMIIRECNGEVNSFGPLQRTVRLSPNLNTHSANASIQNGYLTVSIPKK